MPIGPWLHALARALMALVLPYLALSLALPGWPTHKAALLALFGWLFACCAYAGVEVARRIGADVLLAGSAACVVLAVDFVGLRGALGMMLVGHAGGSVAQHVQIALLGLPLALPVAFGVGAAAALLARWLGFAAPARPDVPAPR